MPWQNDPAKRKRDAQVYGPAWKRARDACLRAASWHCEIRTPGVCIGAASEADHIDGAENDPRHQRLRAACGPCHKRITAQQGGGYRSGNRTPPDPEPRPRTDW
jgi:hypothetical protein